MTTGLVQEQNLEKQIKKQMGCMSGFLQIFDRHHILTGKRLYSTKRLPPTPAIDSTLESEKSIGSPAISRELEKPNQLQQGRSIPSPDRFKQSPVSELRSPTPAPEPATPSETTSKLSLPLPVFEFKEGAKSSWKFCKEAPRLSLDSRAIVDAKGSLKPREIRTNAPFLSANRCEDTEEATGEDIEKERRSTSVIARLMGLEPLPNSDPEPAKKAELRRSASESRVSKDQYRFIDGINFQIKQSQPSNSQINARQNQNNGAFEERMVNVRQADLRQFPVRNVRGEPAKAPQRGMVQKKSFYDSADFFPEQIQSVSIYGEIEKRLKMQGIDEPSKDLETLKQILEALQLKGLLHPKKPSSQATNLRNFIYDESPIVVMKPGTINRLGRVANDFSASSFRSRTGPRRNLNFSGEMSPAVSLRRDRPEIDRNVRNPSSPRRGRNSISPTRSETSVKSPSRRRPLSVDTQRKVNNETTEHRRVSPRSNVRRIGSDQTTNRSPRLRKQTAEICQRHDKVFTPAEDEASTISDSISTSSQTDTERWKAEDYKEGRSLLERCDKLLHSIAEITASELQPSPVSVLDSSFYKEESSPSPVMKRSIDLKDLQIELEDDIWSPGISSVESKTEDDDCDFAYISDIFRASNYLPGDSDVFLLLEKQQYLKGKDISKVSRLRRKLIFNTINEILNRRWQLPPWKVVSYTSSNFGLASLQEIWSEFQKIRERDTSEDLINVICGVLKRDLAGDAINGDCPIEMSEAVLDIERLIFKDLIGETICDLAAYSGKCNPVPALPRRKLIF